jgi:hypothetical protein
MTPSRTSPRNKPLDIFVGTEVGGATLFIGAGCHNEPRDGDLPVFARKLFGYAGQ